MSQAFNREHHTYGYILDLKDDKYHELIDGVIYSMAAPSLNHQRISMYLLRVLANYLEGKPCEVFHSPFSVFLNEGQDIKNQKDVVLPDITVVCDQSKFIKQGYKGAPEFIIEIVSPSTIGLDYVKKLNLYNEYGVKEYWIVNPLDETISVFFQGNTVFNKPIMSTFQDKVSVNIFTGLTIDFSQITLMKEDEK